MSCRQCSRKPSVNSTTSSKDKTPLFCVLLSVLLSSGPWVATHRGLRRVEGVSGGGGIRTHEGLHPTAFRERHFRPLRHLSRAEYSISRCYLASTIKASFSL